MSQKIFNSQNYVNEKEFTYTTTQTDISQNMNFSNMGIDDMAREACFVWAGGRYEGSIEKPSHKSIPLIKSLQNPYK